VSSEVPAPHHHHFQIYTHNELLTTYRGDIGGKNGYTVAAQGTYVGAATRHGQTILVTLMHANPNFWPMARSLLDWGFKANPTVTPVGHLVPPLAPGAPPIAPKVAAGKVLSGSVLPAHGRFSLAWRTLEIAAAILTTVVFAGTVRRRRIRRRAYRPRLRLPPL
jgi:D-alanyl-D-alanine carboxypeptidase (penicillin-binding protein 5/6)